MKFSFTLAALFVATFGFGQCTLTGLNAFYCTSDSGSQLTATCGGSSGTILGPGMSSSGFFDPSGLQDSIPITVLSGTTTYIIDQQGTFDPDTASGGTSVSLSDDAVSGNLQIGFSFRFFDNQYTTFQISSNGFITFGGNTDNGCCSGDQITNSATPNNFIAFAWEDLDPDGVGSINYQTVGTAPNRVCLVNFVGIPHYPGPGPNYNVTSQVQLWEGCGRIEIHTTTMPSDGGSHTMGIENSNGSTGYAVTGRNSTNWSASNDYVAFQPNCGDTFWTVVSPGPTLALTADSNDCFLDSNATVTVSATGASPFSYSWSNGGSTATLSNLPQGTYSVTVTDDDGCTKTGNTSVYSPPFLSVNLNGTNTVCESDANGHALANPSGGVSPYSFAWSNGGSGDSIGGLVQGTYTATITDANGCENTNSVLIDFDNEDPVVDLGPDKMICPGKIALLTTTPGYEGYAWSTGDTVPNIVVQAAGTYTVSVTTTAGCVGSDEITVIEAVPEQVELGPNKEGFGPIAVDAGSQFTQFLWSTGSNAQVLNVGASGTYTVTVADSNGCSSSDDIKVNIWPAGVQDLSEGEMLIFPNPARDHLTLLSASAMNDASIVITDMKGQLVYQATKNIQANEPLQLDVSELPRGNYSLEIRSESVLRQRSFILQ